MPLFQGKGGAVFDIDVPAEGTNLRENFDAKIESGDLVRVGEDEPAKPAKPAAKPKPDTEAPKE